jgi:hypothetical protein
MFFFYVNIRFGSTEVKKPNSVCSVVKKKCMVIVKLCQQWEEEM